MRPAEILNMQKQIDSFLDANHSTRLPQKYTYLIFENANAPYYVLLVLCNKWYLIIWLPDPKNATKAALSAVLFNSNSLLLVQVLVVFVLYDLLAICIPDSN